ncbi:MAG: histidine kinase [Eubacteriales bacterium]|nr:histidine kinase [Eubacteriales bacterium]
MAVKKWKIPWKSFRFRIMAVTMTAVTTLLIILVFNNVYAINVVHNQVFETNYRVLNLFMSNVDNAFEDVENFFVGFQSSTNLVTAAYTQDDKEFYTAQARMVKELEAAIPSYSYIEDLFVYVANRDQFQDASDYGIGGEERTRIRAMAKEIIAQGEGSGGKWIWYWIGSEPYLIRILKMRDTYMGACVKVSTLVERLREDGFGEMEYLAFCTVDGEELGHQLPALTDTIQITGKQQYYRKDGGNRERFMMLSVPSSCGDYGLVALIRDNNILEGLQSFRVLIVMLAVLLILFLIGFTAIMRRWVLWPLSELVRGMKCLSEGQFDIHIQENVDCEEFAMVNKAFDDMSSQIADLKIDVYEESIRRQRAELQYMKLQANPHFYINCLNVIHNLSMMGRNDLLQQMTTYLGNHLRYTMEGSALDTLERELACVENYLQIQQLRFPDSIVCEMEIGEDVRTVLAPPLLIQTFVENTVKYQVTAGEITHIWIRAVRQKEDPHMLEIEIRDDGEGYPERVLECLKKNRKILDEKGEHFGIRNVSQRLWLLYHDTAKITCYNDPQTGGACALILLPDDIKEEANSTAT